MAGFFCLFFVPVTDLAYAAVAPDTGHTNGDLLMTHIPKALSVFLLVWSLTACAPEAGSEEWCEDMADKPKGDWSANEAAEFAKSCILKSYEDD